MKTAHLNALRALEATLRLGSFRAAADELNVTPAAVGQQIRALESYIGRPLFDRRPSGAMPSEAADEAASRLTSAFRELSGVLAGLSARPPTARVAVTMTMSVAEGWLPHELPGFFAQVDEVDLRLDSSRTVVDLAHGEFDFAIRHAAGAGEGNDSLPLFPSLIAPLCTRDFARRYGLSPETRSLAEVPLSHVPFETSDPGWIDWPDWCAAFGVGLGAEQARQVSTGSSGLQLARAGLGLVLCAMVDSFDAIRCGDLVLPFGPGSVMQTAYWYRLVWLRDRRLGPVQRRFRDWIAERGRAHCDEIGEWLGFAIAPPDQPIET